MFQSSIPIYYMYPNLKLAARICTYKAASWFICANQNAINCRYIPLCDHSDPYLDDNKI